MISVSGCFLFIMDASVVPFMPPRLISTKHTSKVSFPALQEVLRFRRLRDLRLRLTLFHQIFKFASCRRSSSTTAILYLMPPMFCKKLRCSKQHAAVICSSKRSSAVIFSCCALPAALSGCSSARPSFFTCHDLKSVGHFRIRRSVLLHVHHSDSCVFHFSPRTGSGRSGSPFPSVSITSILVDRSSRFTFTMTFPTPFFPLHCPVMDRILHDGL